MSLSLFTALPPSKATLRNVFENTRDLNYLCDWRRLNIPDNNKDVDSATEYYSNSTDQRKMRKVIFSLDLMGDTALADSVMEFAEPPAGMATQYNREHNTVSKLSYCVPLVRLKPTTLCVVVTKDDLTQSKPAILYMCLRWNKMKLDNQ